MAATKLKVGTDLAHDENRALGKPEENQYFYKIAKYRLRAHSTLPRAERKEIKPLSSTFDEKAAVNA